MAIKKNEHVMTAKFREGLIATYVDAIGKAGVKLAASDVKPHMNSTATVTLTESQLETVRAAGIDGYTELSGHGNNGAIKLHCTAALKFLTSNRPTLTDEERKAKGSKGTGKSAASKEEAAKRRAAEQELNRKLRDLYEIPYGDVEDESEGDDDSDE
jgi:hypothetical protein